MHCRRIFDTDMQKSQRHEIIRRIIAATKLRSQDELASLLRKNGFCVTQASVSRDLDELGIVKIKGAYRLPEDTAPSGTIAPLKYEIAGENLVVLRLPPGMASAAAVVIDAARIDEVVGTIAGDDTIFVAVKGAGCQKKAMRRISELFAGRSHATESNGK